jgi:biopolymer transport protein ExbB/TolQ
METLMGIADKALYGALAVLAVWGAFCVVVVWRRVAAFRFRDEAAQSDFLDELDAALDAGDVEEAVELCEADRRALPQLALLALANRDQSLNKLRQLVVDRFQRDVLADLEYRLSWISTVVKSAPMVGLLGTVVGMMSAFTKLGTGEKVDPGLMAQDISLALITTACGLAIAIPLVLCTAGINVRIRKMEDLMGTGLARLLESLGSVLQTPVGSGKEE